MKASKEGGRGREKGRQREGRREGILAKNVFIFFKQKPTKKERKEGREEGRKEGKKELEKERKKTQYMSRFQPLKFVSLDSDVLSVAPSSQCEDQDCLKMTLRIPWLLRH